MAVLTLYGPAFSTYVRTVRLLLETIGAEYTLQEINFFKGDAKAPEYIAKNPFKKVPTLDVDGEILYETIAINEYLNEIIANHQFAPAAPFPRARMRQMIAIIDSYLYSPAIQNIVIQRLIVPSQGGKPDEDKIQDSIGPAQTAVKALEALITGTPYLLGNQLTLADFHLIPIFVYLAKTPEFETVMVQVPKLKAWWEHASQLPVVQKVCA